MADKTFTLTIPPVKAVDLGDDTHAVSVSVVTVPGGGTNTIHNLVGPPLKMYDLGDGTYAVACSLV